MLCTRYSKAAARLLTSAQWLVILLFAFPGLVAWSAPAAPTAALIVVNTTADEFGGGASCSLREAIQSANTGGDFGGCAGANATANTIRLPSGTYTLTGAAGEDNNASGDLDVGGALTIDGAGSTTTIIQAGTNATNGVDRVLDLHSGTVTINNVTIRYGKTTDGVDGTGSYPCHGGDGGGIYVLWGTTLILNDCVVSDNRTGDGFDDCSSASVSYGTGGDGGGIFTLGVLELNNTRVMGNETGAGGDGGTGYSAGSGGAGGGILLGLPTAALTLSNSAVYDNRTGPGGRGADATSGDAGAGGVGGHGGGVHAYAGDLTLIDSSVSRNSTGAGGDGGDASSGHGGYGGDGGDGAGIYVYAAAVAVVDSLISGNETGLSGSGGSGSLSNGSHGYRGRGGGLWAYGGSDITLTASTIRDNGARRGGGFYNSTNGTAVTLANCTLSGNLVDQHGGAIYSREGATLVLTNSTVSGNRAYGHGGGIYNSGITTLSSATVAYNTADQGNNGDGDGGGLFTIGTLTMTNTIVARNGDKTGENPDCAGTVTSGDYNLLGISDSISCTFVPQGGDLQGTTASPLDPLLGALGDKGGPTWTHSLSNSSPAVDQIPAGVNGCVLGVRDQRGVLRFPPCDIGAYEGDQSEGIYLPVVLSN